MLYVFTSGQLGVAMAAIPQVGLMIFGSLLVFGFVIADIGGFQELATALRHKPQYFHMAGHGEAGVPGGVYLMGLILTLITYPIINQTVAQRFLATRSEVDARVGCFAGLVPWYLVAISSCLVGFCAVVLYPDITSVEADYLYPRLLQEYLPTGLLGLAVAAMVVASMSTGAGIATALGGLFTVDIYARFIRPDAEDAHYLRITRIVAAVTIIIGSIFARAIPAMGGLLPFYLAFTGSLFLPMTVPYIGGALYSKAGRQSGMAAVIGGFTVGAILLLFDDILPLYMSHPQWRPLWSFGAAWLLFFTWSIFENRLRGPVPDSDIAAALNRHVLGAPGSTEEVTERIQSRLNIHPQTAQFSEVPRPGVPAGSRLWKRPATYEIMVTLLLIAVLFLWW
jgi:SSS family solute:Na+ symporter